MPKHEFGIIDDVSNNKYLYEQYEPKNIIAFQLMTIILNLYFQN